MTPQYTATNLKAGDQVQFKLSEFEPVYTGVITQVLRHSILVDANNTNVELDFSEILAWNPAPKPFFIGDRLQWSGIKATYLGKIDETGHYVISYHETDKVTKHLNTITMVVKPETVSHL